MTWIIGHFLAACIVVSLGLIGGGFAIVPALVLLANIPMKQAIGTSLLIIVFNSVAGFLGYLGHVSLDWNLMLSFIVAASIGTVFGAYLAEFVPASIPCHKIWGVVACRYRMVGCVTLRKNSTLHGKYY
ncbi:putative conserved domain protein [Calothrix sp. NIES-4071]|nr:putative conserved domain protein [Calothrix sp. NIES-4071]BAZ55268.1 putative conserved domain protein [Calothrix sp. NIES-4105]